MTEIERRARAFLHKFQITKESEAPTNFTAHYLWGQHAEEIANDLKKASDCILGKLAASAIGTNDPVAQNGVTTIQQVHTTRDKLQTEFANGRQILIRLATTAVVARMADVLNEWRGVERKDGKPQEKGGGNAR